MRENPTKSTTASEEAALAKLDLYHRKHKALALASLMARAARESCAVSDLKTSEMVDEGLFYLEEDHVDELGFLLGLRPDPADET